MGRKNHSNDVAHLSHPLILLLCNKLDQYKKSNEITTESHFELLTKFVELHLKIEGK